MQFYNLFLVLIYEGFIIYKMMMVTKRNLLNVITYLRLALLFSSITRIPSTTISNIL
ncbi:MAG: hypothetical protein ACI924_000810 [Flavobacterium sp.]|jgi:hypothetical protein